MFVSWKEKLKMKYKVGDKVKIKKELILDSEIEKQLKYLNTDRMVTISSIGASWYEMKEIDAIWRDEHLVEIIFDPILTRWEILDL